MPPDVFEGIVSALINPAQIRSGLQVGSKLSNLFLQVFRLFLRLQFLTEEFQIFNAVKNQIRIII
jgi:hypothetical protein